MPLYVGDYLADTGRLTTEQHGAYLLMLMDYWRSGPLPDDDAALAQIARLSPERWKQQRNTLSKFFNIDAGEWHHKRVDAEREKAEENRAFRKERAKKAAAARWDSEQPGNDAKSNAPSTASSTAQSNSQAMLNECPSPSSSSSSKPSTSKPSKTKTLADARFVDFWTNFPRKEAKKKAQEIWRKNKLGSLADQIIDDVQRRCIDAGQWKGKDTQFIPLPATYLNQRRFEDEWQSSGSAGRLRREDLSAEEIEKRNQDELARAESRWGNS